MNELSFITDASLRKTVEDSIEYTYVLFEESKKKTDNKLFAEETYRVIILYVVSVIEAILLYLYKKGGYEMKYTDYKFINTLPEAYRHEKSDGCRIIVAVQKDINKSEHQIGLSDLVNYFRDEKKIIKSTSEEILEINDLRNTFHLNKPRGKIICDIKQVERALKLLVYIIQKAPKGLLAK
jgi:hypothetical protein